MDAAKSKVHFAAHGGPDGLWLTDPLHLQTPHQQICALGLDACNLAQVIST
jgi:hypothetical protein